MNGWLRTAALLAALQAGTRAHAQEISAIVELSLGVRHVQDGDFESGLLVLDRAVRRLAAETGRAPELARAYLYLGVAYLGLGQESLARAKLRQALAHDPDLSPGADDFSAKVLRVFGETRRSVIEAAAVEKDARKRRGAGGVLLLGVGGAAAAAIVATAADGPPPNRPPAATLAISPDGQAIVGVTRLTFTATASDPDGDSLSYNWSFGDGASASGQTVTHVFAAEGSHRVALTVSDGPSWTIAEGLVTVRTLTGVWRPAQLGIRGTVAYELQHAGGARIGGAAIVDTIRLEIFDNPSRVTDPRGVSLTHSDARSSPTCVMELVGTADPTLTTITGIEYCTRCPVCAAGRQAPMVLTRQ